MKTYLKHSPEWLLKGLKVPSRHVCFVNPGPSYTNSPNGLMGGSAPDGFQVGSNSQSLVSFYGTTPAVPQRYGANQGAIPANPANGILMSMTVSAVWPSSGTISATTISPINVVFQSQNLVSSADIVLVNKILPQAGIGICQARVSTVSNVLLQYINMTNANVTQTVTETVIAVGFRGLAQTVTLSPPVVAANTIQESVFTVTGIAPGMLVYAVKPTEQLGLGVCGARAVSYNQLGLTFINNLSTAVTPTASEAYQYVALNSLNASNNMMVAKVVNSALTGAMAAITGVTTRLVTVTGFAVTDDVLSAQRTLSQQDLALVGCNVNAANQLALTWCNTGQSVSPVTPTTGETYTIPFQRPQVGNPMVLQSVTLTPTIIGALTTAEVQFAVSNITVSSCVWVNKPSFTSGIAVVGCRAVSTNVIGITYVNNTSASITPPVEQYLVGNFPNVIGAGNQLQQQVLLGFQQGNWLSNEVRQTLIGLGILVGS